MVSLEKLEFTLWLGEIRNEEKEKRNQEIAKNFWALSVNFFGVIHKKVCDSFIMLDSFTHVPDMFDSAWNSSKTIGNWMFLLVVFKLLLFFYICRDLGISRYRSVFLEFIGLYTFFIRCVYMNLKLICENELN